MAKRKSKYQPLYEYLRDRPRGPWATTFEDVEDILGFPLPDSADDWPAWWSSSPKSGPSRAIWIRAGYRTEVNRKERRVTFFPDDGADLPAEPDPTKDRLYLIKVNETACPKKWEHGDFSVEKPRHGYAAPAAGDPVLVWVNGEGNGLIACAEVEYFTGPAPNSKAATIRIRKVTELPGERVDGQVLNDFDGQDELLDEIKSDRTGQLRGITPEMWAHLFSVRDGLNDHRVPDADLRRTVARMDGNIGSRVANSGRQVTRICPTRTSPPPDKRRALLLHLWNKQKGFCELCDRRMMTDGETDNPLMKASPDRIDSGKGEYEDGNLQLVHLACNHAKNDGAADQFEEWIKMVRRPSLRSGSRSD